MICENTAAGIRQDPTDSNVASAQNMVSRRGRQSKKAGGHTRMDKTREHMPIASLVPSFVQVDAACHRFEAEWKAGREARIEDYLAGWEEPERSKLLYELMNLEISYRRQQGDQPVPEEYESRFSVEPPRRSGSVPATSRRGRHRVRPGSG